MNRTLIIAIAATGLAVAGPVAAHHNIPDEDRQDFVAEQMSVTGLDAHNDAVEGAIDQLADMDPANDPAGNACTDLIDIETDCGPGNTDNDDRRGMEREPWYEPEAPQPPM